MKKQIAILSLLLGSLPLCEARALTVSSDTKGYLGSSYGEKVLNAILQHWQKPQVQVSGRTAITLRIAKDGRPYSCEIRQNSTSTVIDNSICQTVAQIAHFPPLEANDTGEVYLSFVHDDNAFLQPNPEETAAIQPAAAPITGSEQVETIKNPIENPLEELQQQSQTDIESAPITENNARHEQAIQQINSEFAADQQSLTQSTGAALPLATEPQPQTIVISREEALQPPSADLADPSAGIQAYSQEILKQAAPKIRIPSSIEGTYQVVVRVDLAADGTLKNASINKSSQNQTIDSEILRVLRSEVHYPPIPNKSDQSLWLTFNVRK